VLAKQLAQAHPENNKEWGAAVTPLAGIYDPEFRRFVAPLMMLLMVLVALILLLACANAANLLLAQASNRSREMAIRAAIGASRSRLIRQVLTEGVLLSFGARCVAMLFAKWTAPLLMNLKPPMLSFITIESTLDWRVWVFTFLVSLLTAIIFGLAPALRSSKVNVVSRLRDESTTAAKSRLRNALVVGQVALCMLLLIGAGLCLRSLQNAESIDPGFEVGHRLAVSMDFRPLGYPESRGRSLLRQMLDHVSVLPGVRSASFISYLPLGFTNLGVGIDLRNYQPRPGQPHPTAGLAAVGPGYFHTMGIPLLQGREFNLHDTDTTPGVVIINQEIARRYFPDRNPLGQRISFVLENHPSFEIVGVVKTGKYRSLRESTQPFMYRPVSQFYSTRTTLVIETVGDPKGMIALVQAAVHEIDSSIPVVDAETLEQYMRVPLFTAHLTGILLGALGLLALSLAMAGLYAVVAYLVSQRTYEIGVRMALGAERSDVLKLVLGQGFKLALIGIAIGVGGALVLTRFLTSLLYGVQPTDPLTFVAVSLLLSAVALAASYIPAHRATKVDPAVALRYQ
jgi:putative ABC transport system permease protein